VQLAIFQAERLAADENTSAPMLYATLFGGVSSSQSSRKKRITKQSHERDQATPAPPLLSSPRCHAASPGPLHPASHVRNLPNPHCSASLPPCTGAPPSRPPTLLGLAPPRPHPVASLHRVSTTTHRLRLPRASSSATAATSSRNH
jgi:hypothetical protein